MDDNFNFQPEYSTRKLLGGYSYSNAYSTVSSSRTNFHNELDEIGSYKNLLVRCDLRVVQKHLIFVCPVIAFCKLKKEWCCVVQYSCI